MRTLDEYAKIFRTDKSSLFHNYCHFYEKQLKNINPINILEIGIGTDKMVGYGGSLKMWGSYYPKATVLGLDIDKISVSKTYGKNIKTSYCDSSNKESLVRTVSGNTYDIIIDDGSHMQSHQHISLDTLWPFVRSGGVFIMEDIHHWDINNSFSKTKHDDPINPPTKFLLENENLTSTLVPSLSQIRNELSKPIVFYTGRRGIRRSLTAVLHKR
jgi:hypothetical protein